MLNKFADMASAQEPVSEIDIKKYAAAGHKWLFIKATEGTGYVFNDGFLVAQKAHDNGINVGFYHWIDSLADAKAQAEFFVRAVEKHISKNDRKMADFEWPWQGPGYGNEDPTHRATQLLIFQGRSHVLLPDNEACNYTSAAYCSGPMINAVSKLPVIQAAYTSTRPIPPASWDVVAWQYTNAATVPGFPRPLDYNRILDREWFQIGKGKDSGMSEQLTREEVINLIIQGQRALVDGEKHGPFGPHNALWAGTAEHLRDRFRQDEARIAALEKAHRK